MLWDSILTQQICSSFIASEALVHVYNIVYIVKVSWKANLTYQFSQSSDTVVDTVQKV